MSLLYLLWSRLPHFQPTEYQPRELSELLLKTWTAAIKITNSFATPTDAMTLVPCVSVCSLQVHHRLFVCSNAHEQKSNTQGNTTVVNITPGSERLSATGLKVSYGGR